VRTSLGLTSLFAAAALAATAAAHAAPAPGQPAFRSGVEVVELE
jgi:hypothetical protein